MSSLSVFIARPF